MSSAIVETPASAALEVRKGESFAALAIHLAEIYTGGEVVRLAPNAQVNVAGTDDLAISYQATNWLSGVVSGSLYAFRALKEKKRVVVLSRLVARLGAADMPALASLSVCAVAMCLHRDPPPAELDGWTMSPANGPMPSLNPVPGTAATSEQPRA